MTIHATGIAVGIAAGGAGGVSVNVSGAGVVAFNDINNGIEASIVGSTVTAGGNVTVHAEDRAGIKAELLAVTVSAGGAGAASVNVTVSVTYAENTMSGSLLATIDDSTVTSTSGSVTVDAFADNLIEADGVAVGVSVGGAGGVSINVAASAVLATAVLTNVVEASIIDGSNVAANSVSATATDESTVDATLVAASVSIGGAGAVSVNASIAVSVARVDFGTNTRALISGSKVLARTGDVSL
ncbi:hypothetical protein, partial [Mesorhizobium sp. M2C.T.Ca.TU.002.02.1.1]|uniref:hypothetical protein n=1 Tax=Mesorhizobium sp. M2C.T.Ca.TU.002.02.1.1 TaxID=2496788 RepID=UPI000FD4B0BC